MTRGWLLAAACGVLVGIPALASAQYDPPATGEFEAVNDTPDPTWHANGTTANTLTIATGGTVTFHYDSGVATIKHNVYWPATTSRTPARGSPTSTPGAAVLVGLLHLHPAGQLCVRLQHPHQHDGHGRGRARADPTATPARRPAPDRARARRPRRAPRPVRGGSGAPPQSTLRGAVKLASGQRGDRVRGTVSVKGAKSRLEVAVFVERSALAGGKSHTPVRVGRWVKAPRRRGRSRSPCSSPPRRGAPCAATAGSR